MNQPINIQQQQAVNIGMMQTNQMINQNQMQDQKDLRHLLISPNPNQQQASMGIGQSNINQIQQHPPPQTSQNWINTGQQLQQQQQPIQQQQQLYMGNQGGIPQQQQKQPQQQNFQYYQ